MIRHWLSTGRHCSKLARPLFSPSCRPSKTRALSLVFLGIKLVVNGGLSKAAFAALRNFEILLARIEL
jgi:hypothetical protein